MRTVEKDKWCHGESEYKGDRVRTELERKHRRRFFFFNPRELFSRKSSGRSKASTYNGE